MKFSLLVCLGLIVGLPLFGQTAERLDEILAQDELTVGSAAYIAAASGGLIGEGDGPEDALAALADLGFPSDSVSAEETVRLNQYAYMLMLAHDRRGGLMYTLFPGPRYAFRELRFERVIEGRGDPIDPLSGSRALRLAERLTTIVEAEE